LSTCWRRNQLTSDSHRTMHLTRTAQQRVHQAVVASMSTPQTAVVIPIKFIFLLYFIQLGITLHCHGMDDRGLFSSALYVCLPFVALHHSTASFPVGGPFVSALYMHSPFVVSHRSTLSCLVGGLFSSALHVHSPLLHCIVAADRAQLRHALTSPVLSCDTCCTCACLYPKHCVELASMAEGATTVKPDALECWVEGKDGGGLQGAGS
jgi:hypothetical protein